MRRLCKKQVSWLFLVQNRVHQSDNHSSSKCVWAGHFYGRFALCLCLAFAAVRVLAQEQTLQQPEHKQPKPVLDTEWGVGSWIWAEETFNKQACRLWKSFNIPTKTSVARATLRLTADNGFRLFMDGRELGRGSDWRYLTEFDLTRALTPGQHTIAIEAFNERAEAGVLLGLQIELVDGRKIEIASDDTWWIVPNDERHWEKRTRPGQTWHHAKVVGAFGQPPWKTMPYAITQITPPEQIQLRFWQRGWFQLLLLSILLTGLVLYLRLLAKMAVHARAQAMLARERLRIARDIHDDVGSALTQLILQGEVAKTEFPEGSPARVQLDLLCDKARAVSHALEEVVWAVNSRRDTLRDFTSYVCKYAQEFMRKTPIRCRLDVEPEMPASTFDLATRRGLFLAVKEALSNVAKHSQATEVFLRIKQQNGEVIVIVEDNGKGFDIANIGPDRNGLINMSQRLSELGGQCTVWSEPGNGSKIEFRVPLTGPAEPRQNVTRLLKRLLGTVKRTATSSTASSQAKPKPMANSTRLDKQ